MSNSYFTHTLNDSILHLRRSDFAVPSALVLSHGQEHHLVPYQAQEGDFYSFPIPDDFLSNVKSLEALQVMLNVGQTHVDLKAHPNYPDLLSCFDVDTPEVFWARVSTPARPVRDEHLLGVLCKRAVLRYQNFSVYGVALCALGYRILDRQLPQDPDAAWLLEKAERMLNWQDTITPYEDARWSTSVLMLLAYYHLAQSQVPQAMRILNRMQHYRSAMRIAPLIQTNLARANMLLADYYMAQGEYNRATWFLEDVKHIAKEGVWWSDLHSDPVTAMYKYTEFDVVLCAAKEAARVLAIYSDVQATQQKKVIRLSDLGGYVHVLNQRGKLNHAS